MRQIPLTQGRGERVANRRAREERTADASRTCLPRCGALVPCNGGDENLILVLNYLEAVEGNATRGCDVQFERAAFCTFQRPRHADLPRAKRREREFPAACSFI